MSTSVPLRAAVAGCTGYIGMQCTALLHGHPQVELVRVMGRSHAGRRHRDAVPGSQVDLPIEDTLAIDSAQVVLAALPHTLAAAHAREWLSAGAVVIDLSADFRLRDPAAYRRWYGVEHPAPDLCDEAVSGLVELHRDTLRGADLVAVPGCYPTAALLACAPALRAGLVSGEIIVDAKSGVSGAGRSPQLGTAFAEVNESVHAYAVEGHRHTAEMLQELAATGAEGVTLTFVPHLVPMTRGILVTAYLRLRRSDSGEQLLQVYRELCESNPLLELCAGPPATKSVLGTGRARLHCGLQGGVAVVTVAIDNLMKGGAAQAVQALNVRFGLEETAGLERPALWP